jgi:glycosyltransferase involved in cell wall biosynthesis
MKQEFLEFGMPKFRALIFIVSYNAEAFIEKVLKRIPDSIWHHEKFDVEVLVIDDQSSDNTFYRVADYIEKNPHRRIKVLYNPINQGYGGNQKLGYQYAIQQGFDVVALLHGDGQYAPECLDQMILPIVDGEADVVLGSRMINRLDALRGKMPLYKWVGNQILTYFQNKVLGSHLSEFHTGYRAYSTRALRGVPFEYNSNYFDFDTDILIQVLDTGQRIKEIAIPTYYGEEISYVNGFHYAALILRTTLQSRIVRLNLLYDRRFDYFERNEHYRIKLGYPSSHQLALDRVEPGTTVLDIGSGPGYMAKELAERGVAVISLDRHITPMTQAYSTQIIETDVDTFNFTSVDGRIDTIFLLDIIEHLIDPEGLLLRLRSQFAKDRPPRVIVTTGNVAFFIVRFGLFMGQFNYGKKGILDRDHRRLFTFSSMKRLLDSTGYDVLEVRGIPAPYPEAMGDNIVARTLLAVNRILIYLSRTLFSYQIAYVARPRPMADHLLERAQHASMRKMGEGTKNNGSDQGGHSHTA